MEFFGIDLLTIIIGVGIVGVASLFTLLFYFVIYRPKVQQPLPNERRLGYLTIRLKNLGVNEGYACTAKKTITGLLNEILNNETDKSVKTKLEETEKMLDSFYPIAHRVGRETFIYLFDTNPQDPKFMDVKPNEADSYIIDGVQDVTPTTEWKGYKFVGIGLNPNTKSFTDQEKQQINAALEVTKYLRDAVKNTQKIAYLKEEVDDTRSHLDKALKEKAEIRSDLDRALSALGQKPLTQLEPLKVPGGWREKVKEWFSWPQLLTAAIGYLVSPYLISWIIASYGYEINPPATTYLTALITVFGFFLIPIFRKLFGRWL